MEFNFYQLLGISHTASDEEIKVAYRNLAKKYHPDKHGSNKFYEEHFKKINTAYQTLSKKEKRSRYDLKLKYRSTSINQTTFRHRNTTSNYRRTSMNASKAKQASQDDRKRQKKEKRKIYIITGITLICIVFFSIYFYNFMNEYSAKLALNKGILHEKNKEYFPALESYSNALEYDAEFTEAYQKRAVLRLKIFNDYKGAFQDYNKAINTSEKKKWDLYFSRAKCNIKLKKYEDALLDLKEAASLKPAFDSLYFYQGEINNYKLDQYKEAIINYRQTLVLNGEFTEAHFGKAICHQHLGEFEQSLVDFNKLLSYEPHSGRTYHFRGLSLLRLKDTSAACSDWNYALLMGFDESEEALAKYCR